MGKLLPYFSLFVFLFLLAHPLAAVVRMADKFMLFTDECTWSATEADGIVYPLAGLQPGIGDTKVLSRKELRRQRRAVKRSMRRSLRVGLLGFSAKKGLTEANRDLEGSEKKARLWGMTGLLLGMTVLGSWIAILFFGAKSLALFILVGIVPFLGFLISLNALALSSDSSESRSILVGGLVLNAILSVLAVILLIAVT